MKIGAHDLDLDRGLLIRDGQPVHLRAKTFALLAYLARNAGRVIGKDELLSAVWPDVIVTEDSLTQAVSDLRRVLGSEVPRTIIPATASIAIQSKGAARTLRPSTRRKPMGSTSSWRPIRAATP